VETLGSVNVICTDKTGTLTQNRMVAERVWTPLGQYRVEGQGYEPVGALVPAGARLDDEYLARLGAVAALCNDAVLRPPPSPGGTWQLTGDPTEGALLALAARIGTDPEVISRDWPRIEELAFDAARRRMTTVHLGERGVIVAAKGAVEAVVPVLHVEDRPRAIAAGAVAEQWAREGLRVLALADRHLDRVPTTAEVDLRLVGLVGMADPPRPEAAAAIRECRDAGIEVVMVTGDHAATAKAIAGRMGITVDDEAVMTGDEMQALDDPRLAERIGRIRVFARVDPAQKLRIVDSWHALGAVVAMTGDGVNDAPALRQADIGVAMGAIGTDVSKEAADIVLADDNFATIVHAVEEGRRIYDNIRRTVRYLITTNSGEVWVMFLAPILGLPLPLLPIQILWINLVTDGLPAIALGLQKAEPDTMRRPPRPAAQSLFAQGLWQHALGIGVLMAAVTLPMQAGARAAGWHWQTMVFTTLAFLQLGHALGVRSELRSVLRPRDSANPWLMAAVAGTVGVQLALVYVPALHGVFHTVALRPIEFVIVVTASTAAFFAVELEKWIRRRALPT
jgi:Ca2+-transporting ATPase